METRNLLKLHIHPGVFYLLLVFVSSTFIFLHSVNVCFLMRSCEMDHVRWIICGSSFRLPSHDSRTQLCSLFIQHESMLNVFKMHQSHQLRTCSLCEIDRINGSEDLRLTDVFLTVSLGCYEQTSHDQRRFWQTFCWFSCISAWL